MAACSSKLHPFYIMKKHSRSFLIGLAFWPAFLFGLMPGSAYAIQLHNEAEGIIVHQVGHSIFLVSMLILIFSISEKGLGSERGWRLIQYSAFVFVLWNLDAIFAHFLDNQFGMVKIENISLWSIDIVTKSDNFYIAVLYYLLKLDHLLCVPAIFLFFRGLSHLLKDAEVSIGSDQETP